MSSFIPVILISNMGEILNFIIGAVGKVAKIHVCCMQNFVLGVGVKNVG
jgi:hypothetical protein